MCGTEAAARRIWKIHQWATEHGDSIVQARTHLVWANIHRHLGDPADPLLVSVRSGAKFSMPGMMETVLNVGLNDASVRGLAAVSGDERFAWDSYRRLLSMFGRTVLGIDGELFDEALDAVKADQGTESDLDLDAVHLRQSSRQADTNLPILATQSAGIIGVSHCAQPLLYFYV